MTIPDLTDDRWQRLARNTRMFMEKLEAHRAAFREEGMRDEDAKRSAWIKASKEMEVFYDNERMMVLATAATSPLVNSAGTTAAEGSEV